MRPERPQFNFLQVKKVQNDSRNHQESYRVRIEDPFPEVKYMKRKNWCQTRNKLLSDSEGLLKKDSYVTQCCKMIPLEYTLKCNRKIAV